MRPARHGWVRSATSARVAVPLLVLGLSLAGFLVTTRAVDADRRAAADRRADTDAQQIRGLLDRAQAFEVGLANALKGERVPDGRRFAALEGSAATTVGLTGAMWVERVSARQRGAYEHRTRTRITRLPSWQPAGPAATYLPATFVTGLPSFHPGADVSGLPALAATLRNPTSIFAGTATSIETVRGRRGFFVVQGARFGRGPGSRGFLVVFVPAGWLSLSLGEDPARLAVSLDGRRLAGSVRTTPAAGQTFPALTREWRVDVAQEPAAGLQATLPALAVAWPPATALVAFLVARGMLRRRRAEREVDDIFDLSLDLLCIVGADGYLKRVNPAFERTLGYETDELLSRPLLDFVHPDDRETTGRSIERLQTGDGPERFESRHVRADGAVCWLEWSARPMVERGLIYAAARDVTETRTLVDELAASRRRIVATADETRRRIERNLHDGAQQHLVQTIFTLRRARQALSDGSEDVGELVEQAVATTENANDELRELARGIHPAALSEGGLAPALRTIARRSPIPVELDLRTEDRLPDRIEVTAYYVVSEALANAGKHSNASAVQVTLDAVDGDVRLAISDDGVGGAESAGGSGLVGLKDRVEAAGGRLTVESPPGGGTCLTVELPLAAP